MSSSEALPIPQRRRQAAGSSSHSPHTSSPSSYSSSSSPFGGSSLSRPSSSSKGKAAVSSSPSETISPRRPSLLGSSLAKAEHTVVNLGHSDGPPRLVTCVKSSQGFDWNQELFLPSYANYEASHDLEHKQDPVEDIILTDQEADAMLPQ